MTDFPTESERYHIEGEHRSGETESLFSGSNEVIQGESFGTSPGLIAGDRSDPVLLAGVGYPLLGDLALGSVVAYRAAKWDLPGVAVADCSHTPVAAYQTITETDYEVVLLVGTDKRGAELNDGTPSDNPGAIHEYGPESIDIPDDRIKDLVGQGAMGLNTLENVIIVTKALGEFPDQTHVIAVEPAYDSWGMNVDEFTDPVDDALEEVLDRVREYLNAAV